MLEFKYKQNLTEQEKERKERIEKAFEMWHKRDGEIHELIVQSAFEGTGYNYEKMIIGNYATLQENINSIVNSGDFFDIGTVHLYNSYMIKIEEVSYQKGALFSSSEYDYLRLAEAFFIAEAIK